MSRQALLSHAATGAIAAFAGCLVTYLAVTGPNYFAPA